MGIETDIALLEAKLNRAILETMQNDVADVVRDEMSQQIEQYSFPHSRGPSGGGVRDRKNFKATVEQNGQTTTLRVEDVADFQSSVQGSKPLAVVIETGDPAYRMPKPRPFMDPTQKKMDSGAAVNAFAAGMAKRGLL